VEDEREPPVKLFYRIGEVSQIVGVEPHVLRYWETEFRSIRPQKSRKGQRIYSRRDVEKLLRVKDLLYTHGFTIAGARKRLREVGVEPASGGENTQRSIAEVRRVLVEARHDLAQLLDDIERGDIASAPSVS
jgi:DNA-binding transcriptional MerR regulator